MADRQHPDRRDVDAIFESIVARWDDPPTPTGDATDSAIDSGSATQSGSVPDPGLDPESDRIEPPRHQQSTADVHLPLPPSRDVPAGHTDGAADRDHPMDESVPWRTDPTHSVADALLGQDSFPGEADDDEGFAPPPTAPLPPLSDRLFWGAMIGLTLGPLMLIWVVLTRPSGWLPITAAIVLILGGFACLVLRQPTDRGYDPDQGARV